MIRVDGESMHNGIVFYYGCCAVRCIDGNSPERGALNIDTGEYVWEYDDKSKQVKHPIYNFFIYFILFVIAILIILVPPVVANKISDNPDTIVSATIILKIIEVYIILKLYKYISFFRKSDEFIETSKFHAAEHMCINAYENNELSIEGIKKQSKFNMQCGHALIAHVVLLNILIGICFVKLTYVNFIIQVLLTIISIPLAKYMSNYKIFNLLTFLYQSIFLKKPEDRHIEVAYNCMKALLEDDNGIDIY